MGMSMIGSGIYSTTTEMAVECESAVPTLVTADDGSTRTGWVDCAFAGDVEVTWDDRGHYGSWVCERCSYSNEVERPEPDDEY